MKKMKLVEVKGKQEIKEFLEFPVRLYKGDPNYIRPMNEDIENVFRPQKNKLLRKEGNEAIRWILQNNQGETIGKIAAFINQATLNKNNEQPTGGMGFFDCINDQQAANTLFDACKSWLMKRGIEAMDGPINFGERDRWWGCLKEGFYKPNFCMHYNYPYYNDLLEGYGFQVYFKQYTYHRDLASDISEEYQQKAQQVINNPDYTFAHLKLNNIERYAKEFATIYGKSWGNHDGVKSISDAQALKIFKTMKAVMDEEICWYTYYKNEPVGFYLQLPELNQIVEKVKGGDFNFWKKLLFFYHLKRHSSNKMFGLVFGVVPEHQKKGVEAAMVLSVSQFIKEKNKKKGVYDPSNPLKGFRYRDLEMNWIGDFNPKMMRVVEQIGGKIHKTHITYRKLFNETKQFKRMEAIH